MEPLFFHVRDQAIVHPFQGDGFVRQDLLDVITSMVNVGIAEDQQGAHRRTADEPNGGFKHSHTSGFATDQRAGHVKAIFREQPRQIIARHAARDIWETLANEIPVAVTERP